MAVRKKFLIVGLGGESYVKNIALTNKFITVRLNNPVFILLHSLH